MRDEDLGLCGLNSDVILEAGIIDLEVIVAPLGEEFGGIFEAKFFLFDDFGLLSFGHWCVVNENNYLL